MKTMLRVFALGVAIANLLLCTACKEETANAQALDFDNSPAALPADLGLPPTSLPPATAVTTPSSTAAQVASPVIITNSLLRNRESIAPETIKLSAPLAEIIKMAQAGVGEEVLMAYVTNSAALYEIGTNEILYLHDLGLPAPVISAMIQRDASPEGQARLQTTGTVKPLPPGVALTTPATNIYPPTTAVSSPPEPTPVNPPSNEPPQVVLEQPTVAQEPVTISYFQTTLSPYGTWVDVPGYGNCWRPTVAVCNSSWRPYADHGRWLWTDAGWYWYSDYSWGWAPFHYGRWACPPGVGWVWTPDTSWGPAWVSWRYSSSYCGWAPLPPAAVWGGSCFYNNTVSVGIGFEFGLSDSHYVFLPSARLCDRTPYYHYASAHHSRAIYKDSTVINNYVVGNNNTIINHGVGLDRVAKVTRGDIRQVALKEGNAVRDLGPRRERLETDGKTLTVVRPTLVNSRIESPLKPISAVSGVKNSQVASINPVKGNPAMAASSASQNEPIKPAPVGFRPNLGAKPAAENPEIAAPGKPGNPGVIQPARNERTYRSVAKPTEPVSLGGSGSSPQPIIIKPSNPAASKPINTVPSWMNVSPSSSASANAAPPQNSKSPGALSKPAPTASIPNKSPWSARAQPAPAPVAPAPAPAPAYTRPAATRAPSYRAPESSQPRINNPSSQPSQAQSASSSSRYGSGSPRPQGGAASSVKASSPGKSEGASRSSNARSGSDSRPK